MSGDRSQDAVPLRDLHPQIDRGRARAAVRYARCPARGLRGVCLSQAGEDWECLPETYDDAEKRQMLADLVRTSHRKLTELNASRLDPNRHQAMEVPVNEWTRRRMAIGLLAPDIQKAVLQGTAPTGLDPDKLLSRDMPLDWAEQRRFIGMTTE